MDRWKQCAIQCGKFNLVAGYLGGPGSGKTIKMLDELDDWQKRAYVLAHDPNLDFEETFPKGHPKAGKRIPLVRHDSIASIRQAVRERPAGIHTTHIDPTEIIEFAIELAAAERREWKGKEWGIPVVVGIDEIVSWRSESSRYRVGPVLEDFLSRRRHYHVALLYGAQYPRMMHYSLLHQANKIHMASFRERPDLKILEDGGIPAEYLSKLPNLSKYEFLTYEK